MSGEGFNVPQGTEKLSLNAYKLPAMNTNVASSGIMQALFTSFMYKYKYINRFYSNNNNIYSDYLTLYMLQHIKLD